MNVTITFRSPARKETQTGPSLHERTLEAVPSVLAEQMVADFVQYRPGPAGEKRRKLYRYDQNGDEVLVTLDVAEVIALTASE